MTADSQPNYLRTGIIIAAVLAAAVVLYFFFGRHTSTKRPELSAETTSAKTTQGEAAAPSENREIALTPIQLTPQRMQSIGVSFGTVEFKDATDDIRATGDVEM